MTAELISVGTELLLGNIVNTNAAYLSEKLADLGISCYHQCVVGDNEERLRQQIELSFSRSDLIILSGGLGPTEDDMTKEVTASVMGKKLFEDPHSRARIEDFFTRARRKPTNNNWKQALVPEDSIVIDNLNGTAPGLIIKGEGKAAILLPGPPQELTAMFEHDILPWLASFQSAGLYSRMLMICGIGESRVEDCLKDIIQEQTNPTIAMYAKTGEVHVRLTAKAKDRETADQLLDEAYAKIAERVGNNIYTTDENETLEDVIVRMLKEKGFKLTTAESCTAGLLSGRIMNVPGASYVYEEGYITYSDAAKHKLLGVSNETLKAHTAVSEETAKEMAEGAARAAGANAALSVTGIAGPGGGTEEKPVGLVYIGCYVEGKTRVERFCFTGNRQKNRDYAVAKALTILREELL